MTALAVEQPSAAEPWRAQIVSVIVPAFRAGSAIRACLKALARQTHPAPFEVIVVDNGGDSTLPWVSADFPRVRVVHEARPGSYAARNRGLEVARGSVVAFTDADCQPQPDWLERGLSALSGLPGPGMVVGRIEIAFADPSRPTAVELYESVASFRQKMYLQRCSSAPLQTCWPTARSSTRSDTSTIASSPSAMSSGGPASTQAASSRRTRRMSSSFIPRAGRSPSCGSARSARRVATSRFAPNSAGRSPG